MQQEDVQKSHRVGGDAYRTERIDVDAAHLDVFDAALTERVQRPLAGAEARFRPDRAVELVLDLQQRRRELAVVLPVAHADGRVWRIRLGQSAIERYRVAREAVEAHRQRCLRIALVAEPAHAQRRAVRRVVRPGFPRAQPMRAPGQKRTAHGGRRAEQEQQQPRMPAEVADQGEVPAVLIGFRGAAVLVGLLEDRPGGRRQRKVVVDAGDRLHPPAVAIRQPLPVDRLKPADIGGAVAPERNLILVGQLARHARAPEQVIAKLPVNDLVDLDQLVEAGVDARVHAGDELELRLAEIGGDVRMGERRPSPAGCGVSASVPSGRRAGSPFRSRAGDCAAHPG